MLQSMGCQELDMTERLNEIKCISFLFVNISVSIQFFLSKWAFF